MPRISELDQASSGPLTGDELVAVVQGGVTVKTTVRDIADQTTGAVNSVNGQNGDVVLDAADVGATFDPSLLGGVSGLSGAEILTVEQGGNPVQATTQQIADLAGGTVTVITESANGATHNAAITETGDMVRFTGTGAKVWACNVATGFSAGQIYNVSNRGASGNVTLTPTGITLNAPKGGTLILEPGDTVSVLFVSSSEADVFGSTS